MLNQIIDRLQDRFPPAKVVTLLTPLIFVPAALYVSGYVAEHFPGLPEFTSGQVTAFMVAGALAAVTAAYKRVDGWQKDDRRETEIAIEEARLLTEERIAVLRSGDLHVAEEMGLLDKTPSAAAGTVPAPPPPSPDAGRTIPVPRPETPPPGFNEPPGPFSRR
jgi:hypothetical protein